MGMGWGLFTEWEGEGKRMEITEWEVGEKRNGNY